MQHKLEKIFANHVYTKTCILSICKELLKFNKTNKNMSIKIYQGKVNIFPQESKIIKNKKNDC